MFCLTNFLAFTRLFLGLAGFLSSSSVKARDVARLTVEEEGEMLLLVETILPGNALSVHYLYLNPYLPYQTSISTSLASFYNIVSEGREHHTPEQHWTTSRPPKSIIAPSKRSPGLPLTSELYLEARKLPHLPLMEQLPRIPCDLLSPTSIHPYHGSPPQNFLWTTSLHHYDLLPSSIIQTMLRNRAPYSFSHQARWPLSYFLTSGHPL